MKKGFFLLSVLYLLSCTNVQIKKTENNPEQKFMDKNQIKLAFNNYNEQKSSKNTKEFLSEQGKKRYHNILKLKDFFPFNFKKLLKKQKLNKYSGQQTSDLREFDSPIEDQWNGTCTAHGLGAVIDNKGRTDVSTRHIWSAYKKYSCEAAINAWAGKKCITNEKSWLHDSEKPEKDYLDSKNCKTKLTSVTLLESNVQKMINALADKNPVYIGMTCTTSMLNCDKVLNPFSSVVDGGHALAVVGYKIDKSIIGGGYFIVKNSWGISCGDKGYQYIPFNYCTRNDMYCISWSINKVTIEK